MHSSISPRRPHFLPHNPPQRLLKLRRLPSHMLPQRFVDQRLVAGRPARSIGNLQKMLHQILIQPDRDPRLAARLRLNGRNPSPLSPAEIVSLFHVLKRDGFAAAGANILQRGLGQIHVFKFFDVGEHCFAGVVGFGSPGSFRQPVKAFLDVLW